MPIRPGQFRGKAFRTTGFAVRDPDMSKITVDQSVADAKSRLALLTLLRFNLRLMENWRVLQLRAWDRTLDYEATMILVAVVVVRGELLLAEQLEPEFETLANELPRSRLRKCTVSSIAAATSLNRETVRRRVRQLEESGLLCRSEDGSVQMGPKVLQDPVMRESVQAQLFALSRAVNDLLETGVLLSIENEAETD